MPVTKINREVQKLKKITGSSEKTGWVKENVAHLLSGFVRYADVNLVVNIGHLWGKSALVFCDAMFNNRDFEDNWDPGDDPFSTHSRRNTNDSEIREVHSVDPLIQPLGLDLYMLTLRVQTLSRSAILVSHSTMRRVIYSS